jgi:hypothetical protein
MGISAKSQRRQPVGLNKNPLRALSQRKHGLQESDQTQPLKTKKSYLNSMG